MLMEYNMVCQLLSGLEMSGMELFTKFFFIIVIIEFSNHKHMNMIDMKHVSSRAHRIARRIEAGTVWVNCWLLRDLRVPFGGVKDSGVGREGGKYSIEFFTELKTVTIAIDEQ